MERRLSLDGGVNFRDFGGYETAAGGRVKWRRLFRSGHLAKLGDDARTAVDALDLGLVCDFRTGREREKLPSRLPPSLTERCVHVDIWPKTARTIGDIVRRLAAGEIDDEDVCRAQNAVYREFVADFAPHYARLLRCLIAAEGRPVLIHCTAGKDRTGLGAALILTALGVPGARIVADYLDSNGCPALRAELLAIARRSHAIPAAEEPRFMRLLGAREDSIATAFDAMIAVAGSVERYMNTHLGLTAADRAALRRWYVEG
jgi:protein-tyrosine phosphatase